MLNEVTRRQVHLLAELNHALYDKRSVKLTEDERQLAFEDLSIALAEAEAAKKMRTAKTADGAAKFPPKRTIGNLPAALPRICDLDPATTVSCDVMGRVEADNLGPAQFASIGVQQDHFPMQINGGGRLSWQKYLRHVPLLSHRLKTASLQTVRSHCISRCTDEISLGFRNFLSSNQELPTSHQIFHVI